jgi:hypothetical protein
VELHGKLHHHVVDDGLLLIAYIDIQVSRVTHFFKALQELERDRNSKVNGTPNKASILNMISSVEEE